MDLGERFKAFMIRAVMCDRWQRFDEDETQKWYNEQTNIARLLLLSVFWASVLKRCYRSDENC